MLNNLFVCCFVLTFDASFQLYEVVPTIKVTDVNLSIIVFLLSFLPAVCVPLFDVSIVFP